jgi:NTP pyrophosphatase (non-canonical NTP hydrolase)
MGDDNLTFELRQGRKNNTGYDEIQKMQLCVYGVNSANGWFDEDRTFGDDVALLHSEVSEMLEEFRDFKYQDTTVLKCINKLADKYNEPTEDAAERHIRIVDEGNHLCKPEGVGSEAADVLVRLLDMCERYELDLVFEFWRKVQYNATRGHRHGGKAL